MKLLVHALTVEEGFVEVQAVDRSGRAMDVPHVLKAGRQMAVEPASGLLLQVREADEEMYERYLRETAG